MKRSQRLLEWLDDAANPIVVKELRQAVHGRFLAGILLLFLILQLAVLGVFLLSTGAGSIDVVGGESYGEEVFSTLVGILFFACILCIPIYAAVRVFGERSAQNMALFFISTLSPRRIVAGKLMSNLFLVLLLFSACLPYLSFTYFLRGIDLPTIAIVLSTGFLMAAGAILVAIFLASLPTSRFLKMLLGLAGLGFLFTLFSWSLALSFMAPKAGIGSSLGSWDFWGPALVFLSGALLMFGLVFSLAVAVITPASANRAMPVRRYCFVAWVASAAAAGVACFEYGEEEIVATWLFMVLYMLVGSLLPAISSRDRMSLRVVGEVPRSPLRRLPAFFLFSGSANGVAGSVAMIGATAAAGAVFDRHLNGALGGIVWQLLGICAYFLAYALMALLAQRHLLHRWIRRDQTWGVALVLVAFVSLAPPVLGFLLGPEVMSGTLDFGLWLIFNPFTPLRNQIGGFATSFGLGMAAVMVILAGSWFRRQVAAFRPPAEVAGQPDGT